MGEKYVTCQSCYYVPQAVSRLTKIRRESAVSAILWLHPPHIGRGLGEGGCLLVRSLRQRMNVRWLRDFGIRLKPLITGLDHVACRSTLSLLPSVATKRTAGTQEGGVGVVEKEEALEGVRSIFDRLPPQGRKFRSLIACYHRDARMFLCFFLCVRSALPLATEGTQERK